ncbi:MAG: hypothetical protein ACXABY_01435 [Candidatus Thorarchaeota archaeon]|jgi:hypothetical protein
MLAPKEDKEYPIVDAVPNLERYLYNVYVFRYVDHPFMDTKPRIGPVGVQVIADNPANATQKVADKLEAMKIKNVEVICSQKDAVLLAGDEAWIVSAPIQLFQEWKEQDRPTKEVRPFLG